MAPQTAGVTADSCGPNPSKESQMAAKKTNPAMDFIIAALKSNRNAKYAEIAEAAAKKKLKIYPIMFGRAQALLGIVKSAPRGQGKAARQSTCNPSSKSFSKAVRSRGQAKTRYRAALDKIRAILDGLDD